MFVLERLQKRGLPPATIVMLVAMVAAYAACVHHGGPQSDDVLLELGGANGDLIWRRGELHRLVTASFLHGGPLHLLANAWGLVALAPIVERIWGTARFAIVYVLTGIAAMALSSGVGTAWVSVGASGAIFGLMGFVGAALGTARQRHEVRVLLGTLLGRSLPVWLTLSVVSGFLPGMRVDNLAHVGGLVAGFGLAFVITKTEEPKAAIVLFAVLAALAVPGSFARGWVVAQERDRAAAVIVDIQDEVAARRWDDAIRLCQRELLARPRGEEVPHLYYLQGIALRKLGRLEEARVSLERSFRLRPHVAPAYLLATVAIERSDGAAALEWAERGDRLGPKPAMKIALAEDFVAAGLADEALLALERARATKALDVVDLHRVAAIESRARALR